MLSDYWRSYFDEATLRRGDALREVDQLASTGVAIHVDLYRAEAGDAPVVIFNHGGAGYCRLFVGLALQLRDRGYTVVLPDQRGQGFSGGARGDYTIAECVQNLVDVAAWARGLTSGPLYMAGGSVGGALTYYAAAAGAAVEAIACLNLFDFGPGGDGLRLSRLAGLAHHAGFVSLVERFARMSGPLGALRIPFRWVGVFESLMDARDATFQAQWDADPVPPRLVTLRSLASNLNTPPAIPFEQSRVPTLVINQRRDEMVDPAVTRRCYERLGGPKRYLEIDFGHWSSQPAFWEEIARACDSWFRAHRPRETSADTWGEPGAAPEEGGRPS